ncbi:DNA polymerase [Paracoccus versutus]|uniref:Type-4 uracil-DNA glycosylase n=1 Tax=Paracoccus versutus TaxID=34007 RepID=A0A3D9XQY2_PARVE|nr:MULTISPECIES: UdgX family uracil-DNA binding protein [Paracoccus]REF72836.1 DNA polymerase [Paracoccus versutus]
MRPGRRAAGPGRRRRMSTAEVEAGSLAELAQAEAACTRCPLYLHATQVVPGEGHRQARMMVVGEQPGDKEDLAGRPFVGPAGQLFDQILAEAGIPRGQVFVTNAVKHFKFAPRGKRRLHRRPNAGEIDRCKWWLGQELKLVAPAVLVAMGATAVRSLLGRPATISSLRGEIRRLEGGMPMIVTIHPSWLLRIRDAAERETERRRFLADLKRGWGLVGG